jgi:hypothetical protein
VQSNTGSLYRVEPQTGEARAIDLGGATLEWGDGILLEGHRLYVVQNFLNKVAVVDLDPTDFRTGSIEDELTSPGFDVPTAVVRVADRLYLPNARFSTPPTADTPYDIVSVPLR